MEDPNNPFQFSIDNTSDFSTALASLSEYLNARFTTLNNNPQTHDFLFDWLGDLLPAFQKTYPVSLVITITFGRTQSGPRALTWLFPLPDEISRFTPQEIDLFMGRLITVNVDELSQDATECAICKVKYATLAGSQMGTGALSSEVTASTHNDQAVVELAVNLREATDREQAMAESPVKLACGHIMGENCLRLWISEDASGIQPTCPMCRAIIQGIRDVEIPTEAEVMVTLDGFKGLAVSLGLSPDLD